MLRVENSRIETRQSKGVVQSLAQRIVLLAVLGYEAIGCLVGGSLLIAAPNGSYMDMPVEILRGTFDDFLIPGIILFGLGILNTLAFAAVLRRSLNDWYMAGFALGGLSIWFVVEIIILGELHWLHAMWGLPVLLGWVVAIPLIVLRHDTIMVRKALLACGILSTFWYLMINILVPMQYPGYSSVTKTVSELSAIGAPTRMVWVLVATIYPILLATFGWGVLRVAGKSRRLHAMGVLLIFYAVVNIYWPPMHMREVIAAGGGTISDTLHIVWAMVTLVFNILMMVLGAMAMGRSFRIYTIVTFLVFIVFGILIGMESPGISENLPTPFIGVWERINIAAFMIWIVVLAVLLLRSENLNEREAGVAVSNFSS